MALFENIEEAEAQRQREIEIQIEQAREKRAHELAMAQLKILEQGQVKRYALRQEMRERIIIAVLKLVPVVILALALPVLLLFRREVPQFLQDFMRL
jgi:hypothetical protein